MNLLDLPRPARRRQGIYWASVVASIVVHGGFLAYVVSSRPRLPAMNADLMATAPPPALRRGDREDPPELLAENDPPELLAENLNGEDASPETVDAGTAAIAAQLDDPLPEDHASAGKPLPPAEWLPDYRFATSLAVVAPAAAPPRARRVRRMSLPARRMSRIPATAGQSEWGRDAFADRALAMPGAVPSPPAPLLAAAHTGAAPAQSEERRASDSDMGALGSPVVAVLPKEAGVAMFAARMAEDGPLLPEDRSLAPRSALPGQSQQTHAVPPPARRVAAIAAHANPELAEGKRESGAGDTKRHRAYQAKVRAHLAANKPAGGHGAGRAVVAFNLSPGGGLVSARIVRSSGRPSLDRSVLASVFRSAPFPKPPEGLDPAQLRFRIPFEFR